MRKFPMRAALAAALSIALLGAGATAANAAPVAQPNGSPGGIYLFNEDLESAETNLSFQKDTVLTTSASKTDFLARVMMADYLDSTELADANKKTWIFLSTQANMAGGVNTWNAFGASASSQGGVLTGNFTMADLISGGDINKVFTDGGTYYAGIAWTNNAGAVVYGTVYRTITVAAGTNTYTVDAVTEGAADVAPAVTTQPVSVATTAGADAVFTAAASGSPAPSVKWQSSTDGTTYADVAGATSATLTVPAVTLAQSGTQYRAVFTNSAGSVTTNAVQLTVSAAIIEPTDAANAATKKTIAAPVDAVITITGVPAGTYTAYAWSTPTNLGTVVVPASGTATIPVPAGLQDGAAHTFALLQANNEIVAWGNVVVPAPEFPLTTTTPLTADVTVSGKFALEGVNAGPIALGTAKRGATTTPVALGVFTVTDDRDDLKGWTLNSTVTAFTNAASESIPGTALGLAPKKVGDAVAGISTRATPKVAGDEWTSTLVAEGIAGSYTPETGTQFDADLTFKAPANAKKGTYTSTLTLTLASK